MLDSLESPRYLHGSIVLRDWASQAVAMCFLCLGPMLGCKGPGQTLGGHAKQIMLEIMVLL